MNKPYAKVIADSVCEGFRVTTMETCIWRPMLAEFNTHAFSRNSASMRAIPFPKIVERVMTHKVGPAMWKAEQKGMQAGAEVLADVAIEADAAWDEGREKAVEAASKLAALGIHKSTANRLLEAFLMQTICVTSVNWQNFFEQRCSPLAQDEIRIPAEMMLQAYEASTPETLYLHQWHLPYVQVSKEMAWVKHSLEPDNEMEAGQLLASLSAARCAQLSYLTQPEFDPETGKLTRSGGELRPMQDLNRFHRLMDAAPKHWSPAEHPAMAFPANVQRGTLWVPSKTEERTYPIHLTSRAKTGKLPGWLPLRSILEAQSHEDTYR